VFDEDNLNPRHYRGVAYDAPGLFFTGLPFIYSASSTMIHGTGRDARYIAKKIATQNKRKNWMEEIVQADVMKLQPHLI
jgi:putative flavoprotein involved in K+ transport